MYWILKRVRHCITVALLLELWVCKCHMLKFQGFCVNSLKLRGQS